MIKKEECSITKTFVISCLGIILLVVVVFSGCQSGNVTLKDIAYGPDPFQKMDLYSAVKYKATCVIVIHGGGFQGGDKDDFADHARWFASLGYPTVSMNYRLVPEGRYPKGVDDVLLAMQVLSQRYGMKQFILFGHSAGAYLAMLVTLARNNPHTFGIEANYSAPILAAIGTSGPYDYHLLSGKALQDYEDFAQGSLEKANVLPYADAGDPPTLIIAGDHDTFVPWQSSQDLHDQLPNSVYYLIPGADHNSVIKPVDPAKPAFGDIQSFLQNLPKTR